MTLETETVVTSKEGKSGNWEEAHDSLNFLITH